MSESATLLAETYPYIDPGVENLEELFNLPAYEKEQPLVICVPETVEDLAVRAEAGQFIAAVLSNRLVEAEPSIKRPIDTLCEGIKLAAKGDKIAKKLVEANSTTDVTERSYKNGFVSSPIKMGLTPSGKPIQHDQTLDSVHANSLLLMADHPTMGPRTRAETHNSFRITASNQEGYFDQGYSFVAWSAAENEAGFFTETMSCTIQVTSKSENGLKLESAFVAGIKTPGEKRHDLDTITSLYEKLGVDITGKTPAEIIDTPLLIHNSLIPNGVIDLVKLFDDCAGGTFFGEAKPRQDYLDYVKKCKEKEQRFIPIGKAIAAELIEQADTIDSPLEAIQRLNKISGQYAVDYAIQNNSINPRIFGDTAAKHIEQARDYIVIGNVEMAEKERWLAHLTETSFSCPSVMNDQLEGDKDEYGSLNFNCPSCGHSNTRQRGELMSHCQTCRADVSCG